MFTKLKIRNLSYLKSNSGLRAIIANTGWLLTDRVLRMTVGFILGVWIARYLGVAQYGLFSYATAFVYLFSPLANLGLDNIVVRDFVKDPDEKDKILGTAFWLRFMGACIALILAITTILVLRFNEPLTISLVAILSMAGIFQSMDVIDLWFQSQVQSKYTVFAKTAAFCCIALVKILLIIFHAPLIAFAWSAFAEIVLCAIALLVIYRIRGLSLKAWSWNLPIARALLRGGFPLMLSGLTIMIYMKIDQIMLGGMVDDQAVGVYTAATRISEAWYFIPGAIVSSVTPSIYQAKERSEAEYYQYIGRLLRLMNGIAIAVAIPITVLAPAIINFTYGEAYLQSSSVLIVHIWAAIFVFMGLVTLPCFIIEGLTNLTLQRTALGAIINIILNLLLIPHYTVVGAAIATVISQAVASYFSHAFHPKTMKLFNLQTRSLLLLK
jgi:polysaccharide transporter, PST family